VEQGPQPSVGSLAQRGTTVTAVASTFVGMELARSALKNSQWRERGDHWLSMLGKRLSVIVEYRSLKSLASTAPVPERCYTDCINFRERGRVNTIKTAQESGNWGRQSNQRRSW
jgi:hypothetical protein